MLTPTTLINRLRDAARREVSDATDNFNRAERVFRGDTPEQMARPYGKSGQTCQQILDGYRAEFDAAKETLAYLDEVLLRERA